MTGQGGRIAIRADGGGQIGLGHVMRCLALAEALHAMGFGLDWLTATPGVLPAGAGRLACIHDLSGCRDECAAIAGILSKQTARLLVGDWKVTDTACVAALRSAGWPVVLIGGWTGDAIGDLHVRQSFVEQPPAESRRELSGAAWLLLGEPYRNAPARETRSTVARILVSLGGTATPVLDRIRAAIAGNPDLARMALEIRAPAGASQSGTIRPLYDALASADLAILAGGTTLHEAAALGLPALCIPIAANQHDRAGQFQARGLGVTIDPDTPCFDRRISETLASLAADPARRARMARRGQSLVDGRGAIRLARHLAERFLTAPPESQ